MKFIKSVKLNKTSNIDAEDVFTEYFSDKFRDLKDVPVKEAMVDIFEIDKNATFAELFTKPSKMAMTKGQILNFCFSHKKDLQINGYSTFFLYKDKNEYFVADVSFVDGGRLLVGVYPFSSGRVWYAEYQLRIVSLQQPLETLKSEKTLGSLDSVSLDEAIKICKKMD